MKRFLVAVASVAAVASTAMIAVPTAQADPYTEPAAASLNANGPSSLDQGDAYTTVVEVSTGASRVAARKAAKTVGKVRVVVKLRKNGELKQKVVRFRRVALNKPYTIKTAALRYVGTYSVVVRFVPDKSSVYKKQARRSSVVVS